jgi:hypothetical protein
MIEIFSDGWKCDAVFRTLYSPSYEPISGRGKYVIPFYGTTSYESFAQCTSMKMKRLSIKPGDEFDQLIANYDNTEFWVNY